MSQMTEKQYLQEFGAILESLDKKTTPFRHDTVAKQRARVERARVDKFYFAATYFPHYIELAPGYEDVWKNPDADVDWIAAGFAPYHAEMFRMADLKNTFNLVAGFRESAKSTLLGKIDPIHKIVFQLRWYVLSMAKTEIKAETKVAPIKLELESNVRLRHDFGNLVGKNQWEYGFIVTSDGRAMKGMGREQSTRGEEVGTHRYDHLLLDDISDPTIRDSAGVVNDFVDKVKGGILEGVNQNNWSGVYLCNYTAKGDITDALMTDKNTQHFNKRIFRALVPNDMETKADREIAKKCREAGFDVTMKSAWESHHPTLRLLQKQKDDPETFDTEWMMRPRSRKDQKFKDPYFKFHTKEELRPDRAGSRTYVNFTAVDPSAKDSGDYKAVITLGLAPREDGSLHMPIRRAWIQQTSIDEMLEATYRQKNEFRSKVVGVETGGQQILFKREYLRLQSKFGPLPFQEVDPEGESKESRIERLVPFIKEGMITFDPEDPDQDLLIRQLKAFPFGGTVSQGGLGDDGPDALEMCLRLIQGFSHFGEVGYQTVQKRAMSFAEGAY